MVYEGRWVEKVPKTIYVVCECQLMNYFIKMKLIFTAQFSKLVSEQGPKGKNFFLPPGKITLFLASYVDSKSSIKILLAEFVISNCNYRSTE